MISALQQVLGPALIRSIVWHAQAPVVEYGRIRETFPGPCVRAAPSSLRAGHQPPPLKSGRCAGARGSGVHPYCTSGSASARTAPILSLAGLHQIFDSTLLLSAISLDSTSSSSAAV